MTVRRSGSGELMKSNVAFALETMKDMSKNRKVPMLAMVAVISPIARRMRRWWLYRLFVHYHSAADGQHLNRSSQRTCGARCPRTMPINPIHAALLHTGKILIVTGSGNCPASQAGCPQGPQYPQGAALLDLSSNNINVDADDLGHVLQWNVDHAGWPSPDQWRYERLRSSGRCGCPGRHSIYGPGQYFDFRSGQRVVR